MMKRNKKLILSTIVFAMAGASLSGCGGVETEAKYPSSYKRKSAGDNNIRGSRKTVFGEDGIPILGGKKKETAGDSGIGVNSFLWRATLDTVSFMPLASADPFGGVILTDWYTDPETPNERVKINAFIMGRELKASGIRVRTFRQEKKGSQWQDAPVSEETGRKLEDAILTRARELRISHLAATE